MKPIGYYFDPNENEKSYFFEFTKKNVKISETNPLNLLSLGRKFDFKLKGTFYAFWLVEKPLFFIFDGEKTIYWKQEKMKYQDFVKFFHNLGQEKLKLNVFKMSGWQEKDFDNFLNNLEIKEEEGEGYNSKEGLKDGLFQEGNAFFNLVYLSYAFE